MEKTEKYRKFDEPIHCVYIYLIGEYMSCYIGRTKELNERDLSHRRGRKHQDGSVTYDGLYQFCKEHNIEIPKPIIIENNITGIKSLELEDYWVNQYKSLGWNVLNKAKTGIKSGSLGHVKIWDYESCKEECKKYRTRAELKENSFGCYEVCLTMGWLDEFINEWGKHKNGYWSIKENVLEECKKYANISDFAHKSNGAYKSAKKNGWLDELTFEKYGSQEFSFDEAWGYYQCCGNINETIKHFKTSHKRLKKLFEENGKQIGNHNRKDPLPEEIPEIVKLHENGVPGREIERRFNISRKRIPKVVKEYYDKRAKEEQIHS